MNILVGKASLQHVHLRAMYKLHPLFLLCNTFHVLTFSTLTVCTTGATNMKRTVAIAKGSPSHACPSLIPSRNAHAIPGPAIKLATPSVSEISAYSRPTSLVLLTLCVSTTVVARVRMTIGKPVPKVYTTMPAELSVILRRQ